MRRALTPLLASAALCGFSVAVAAEGRPEDSRPALQTQTPEPAQDTVTTLGDALARAYRGNPTLLAQRAQLRAADYRLAEARSGYGPQLSVSGSYGHERDNFEQAAGGYVAKSAWTATASAILTQPLYTFGRTSAAERGAAAGISFGRSSLRAAEQRVLLDTITAYSVLARDNAGVTIARDNLTLLERERGDTASRLAGHEATSTDLQQVETRVGLGRAQLYAAQEQWASSRAQFLKVVGAMPGDLAPPNPLELPVATLDEAYAMAERSNPVLAAAYAREKVSRATLEANRADLLPRVDLRGRAESGTFTPYTTLRQTTLRGEVTVSAPIFQSGLRAARINEAREANDSDWRLIDAALRDSRAEVAAAWNTMTARHAAIADLRAAVDSAQHAYDGALLQERAGIRTTLDVLDLARELLTARTALNAAITESYVSEARLLSAMGSLEASYLLPDEPLYDPETHYRDARNDGDVPLITPVIRALDGIGHSPRPADRPSRDPAARLTAPGARVDP